MNVFKLVPVLAFCTSFTFGTARAQSSDTRFWRNDAEQIVLVAVDPVLQTELVILDVDDEYHARLDVRLTYPASSSQSQITSVLSKNPGMRFQRVIVEAADKFRLRVPSLGIDRDAAVMPGVDGPYVEETIFLNRRQTRSVQNEIKAGRAIASLSGKLRATVPQMKVIERKELDPAICAQIAGDERTVGGAMARFGTMAKSAIDRLRIQYDSTRESLERDVQQNCFELTSQARVDSFAELLKLDLRVKSPGRPFVGQTSRKSYDRTEFDLQYTSSPIKAE